MANAINEVIDTSQIAGKIDFAANTSVYIGASLIVITIIGLLIWFVWYRSSFKTRVFIIRPLQGTKAFKLEGPLRGKHFFNKNKELRFKILGAKTKGLLYNNEPIDESYTVWGEFNKKVYPTVFFQPNNEGWLQPALMKKDDLDNIKVSVTNADLTYYQSELETMDAVFNTKTFLEKYYLLIIIVFFLIILSMQGCQLKAAGKAAEANQFAAETSARAAENMAEALIYIGARINATDTGKTSNIPELIPIG